MALWINHTQEGEMSYEKIEVAALGKKFSMQIFPIGDFLSDIIRSKGYYSHSDLEIFKRILKPGSTFVDVGANIGWHSIVAGHMVGSEGRVISFEPCEANFNLLQKNIELQNFKNISPVKKALADKFGIQRLYKSTSNSGDHILEREILNSEIREFEEVEVITFDKFLNEYNLQKNNKPEPQFQSKQETKQSKPGSFYNKSIDLIKIDAQGSEPKILAGMINTIMQYSPAIVIEFSPIHITECGNSSFDIFSFIEKNNYIVFKIVENNGANASILEFLDFSSLTKLRDDLIQSSLGADLLLVKDWQIGKFNLIELIAPMSLNELAKRFYSQKKYNFASACCEYLITLFPNEIELVLNYARCLAADGDVGNAKNILLNLTKSAPNWFEGNLEAAHLCKKAGEYEKAYVILKKLRDSPNNTQAHLQIIDHHLGWYELQKGNFKEGIKLDRIGRKIIAWGSYSVQHTKPMLNKNTDIGGKRILIFGEGGIGDEFLHCRFARVLKERGATVYWVTEKPITSVLSRVKGIDKVIMPIQISQLDYDYWTPAIDLPVTLDLDESRISIINYIEALPEYLEKWKARIATGNNLKIGLRWSSGTNNDEVQARSINFEAIVPFLKKSGVDWYSLQVDGKPYKLPDRHKIDPLGDIQFKNIGADFKTWEDTVAAIACLDKIVTTCNVIAHLAAAMGKQVYLLASTNCYYTWASPNEHSLWYATVKIFRQKHYGDWDYPLSQLFNEL